ncbi:MAG: hypothetical protein U0790_08845 [Isosphaeraceae bacterium]
MICFSTPQLFRPGLEGFCRSLAGESARLPGVRRVVVCASTSLWRVEFSAVVPDLDDVAAGLTGAIGRAFPAMKAERSVRGTASTWVAFPAEGGPASVWEVVTLAPGRYRIWSRRLWGRPHLASRLARRLRRQRGVRVRRVHWWGPALDVEVDRGVLSPADLATAAERLSEPSRRPGPPALVHGGLRAIGRAWPSGRGRDLLFLGGSVVMLAVGVVVPGIPSAPFLLFAACFAVRCWPALGEILQFMPRLRAYLEQPLPIPDPSEILRMAATAVAAAALFLVIRPPLPLVLVLELGVLGITAARWRRGATEDDLARAPALTGA